ncbi:hypothetical protein [Halomonas salina]|uniref:Uncharacterized protein n=1 Tax=Halomonas salina TaxID=42565 RepID=A0ABR4WX35_9GAMM|nr:hypothetical protein [Halomonas salina]KGE79303.1 hypothetical protein FP66_11505 [Halomonas salina]
MANSREAQLKWDITKYMTVRGWKAGAADGYDREVEEFAELELTHYRLIKREHKRLRLEEAEGDYGLTPFSELNSGKPHDLNKQRLTFHYRFNDLYGAQISDDDKLRFAGIADRIERDEAVMAQVRSHSEDLVIHGLFPKKVTDAMLGALSDHEKLSLPLWEDEEAGRQFDLLVLKLLARRLHLMKFLD